jgi:glycosyltransferase involved in cell wall biosynthesis
LRIAVVAPPYYEIPPQGYGGIERVCHALVVGLLERGHDVTLIAAGGDHTDARFVPTFPEAQVEGSEFETTIELLHAVRAATALEWLELDVVHDHSRAGPLLAASRRTPTVATVHGPMRGAESQREVFAELGRSVSLVAISEAQRHDAPELNWVGRVYNGIDVGSYPYRTDKDDYVLVLSRLHPQKGIDIAIDAALKAGRRIVVAGSWTIPTERAWFEDLIRPRLGPGVEWVGEVEGEAKRELLAGAACLLFPARWAEPFGLAMVEAMACGTPVVGLRAGSVPEVVDHGRTGVICDRPGELPEAIAAAVALDPHACRARAGELFSADRMVAGYEALYQAVVRSADSGRSPRP